jgi:hypothetical protein
MVVTNQFETQLLPEEGCLKQVEIGAGFYFWQNNYDRALDFATNPPGKMKIIKPAVLGAIFSLGNCLDLTDKKWIDLVKLSYDNLKQSAESEGNKLPVNKDAKDSKDNWIAPLLKIYMRLLKSLEIRHLIRLEGFSLKVTPYMTVPVFMRKRMFRFVLEILIA